MNQEHRSRPIQYFSDEYLEQCRKLSPTAIAEFLEGFREMCLSNQMATSQKLISIRVPENLLLAFRRRCELEGKKYQTQIKDLMREWLNARK